MNPISLEALAAEVPDGAMLALPPDNSLPSVALAKAATETCSDLLVSMDWLSNCST